MLCGNLSISRSGWLTLLSVLHSKKVQLKSDSQGMAWCFSDQSANFRVLSYANQLSLKRGTKYPREGLVSQSSWGLLWASGWRFLSLTPAGRSCFYVLPASFVERVKSLSHRRLPSVGVDSGFTSAEAKHTSLCCPCFSIYERRGTVGGDVKWGHT